MPEAGLNCIVCLEKKKKEEDDEASPVSSCSHQIRMSQGTLMRQMHNSRGKLLIQQAIQETIGTHTRTHDT